MGPLSRRKSKSRFVLCLLRLAANLVQKARFGLSKTQTVLSQATFRLDTRVVVNRIDDGQNHWVLTQNVGPLSAGQNPIEGTPAMRWPFPEGFGALIINKRRSKIGK